MLPFIKQSKQAHRLHDEPRLFVCFFRGNLERRVANIGPSARQSPSSVVDFFSDQQDLWTLSK
jgi:hypothetical protein